MRISTIQGFKATAIALAVTMAMSTAHAEFVANDIAISGLKRVTIESLQTTLPIRLGQTVSDEQLAESIRALYATGHFSDVQANVDGDRVVFKVVERPTIAELNFEGNRLIPKDALEQGLKASGLVVGGVLKQATLQAIKNELENQYASQGYYNTEINVKQTELDGNRVKLDLEFVEGKRARVVDINIIGNNHFSDDDLRQELVLKDGSWNPLSRSDRYTQEKMAASIEKLRAKYLNAGFVRFAVNDATLNVDEEKQKVFIEINLTEGEQYKFGKANFAGDLTYPMDELNKLVSFKEGEAYSQARLDESTSAITNKFGDDGYYYAQIRPVTRINDATRTVDIDYYVDPVRPVYVRRINFNGNHKTKDEVLRREMRQLEGALASNQKIQMSRARLMRTGFFKNVVVDTQPVPNSPDQIDVNFTVEEQASGSSTIAAGYSQSGGVTFQFDVSQNNFMGTGNRVTAGFSRSETRDSYNLSMTNPFFTVNGVSQTIGAYYRRTKYDPKNLSNYVIDAYGGNLTYGYPIDENQRISGGINLDSVKIQGSKWMGLSNVNELIKDDGTAEGETILETGVAYKQNDVIYTNFENKYNTYNALLGWNYSSLDRPVFPTKGQSHALDLTLGFGDKTYQKLVYTGNYYKPFIKGSVLRGYAKLGYGNDLPFYENFYAGGYGSVRGFDQSTLGPLSQSYVNVETAAYLLQNGTATDTAAAQAILDGTSTTSRGQEVGGNALATFGAELILPLPFKGDWVDQVRPVLFVEGGQVFDTTGRANEMVDLSTINPKLKGTAKLMTADNELRYSAGVGVTWYTAIGPISISYAKPLNAKDYDETDNIQFQIGSVF